MKKRPERKCIDGALTELIGALIAANPDQLGHVRPEQLLFVAGAARLEHRASIRPFAATDPRYRKPIVLIGGVTILYEICLRPRFFVTSTPDERLRTIAHELWHISPRFDGSLASERRHEGGVSAEYDGEVDALVERYLASGGSAHGFLAFDGELQMQAWLSRPPSRIALNATIRERYTEDDLLVAIVRQSGLG